MRACVLLLAMLVHGCGLADGRCSRNLPQNPPINSGQFVHEELPDTSLFIDRANDRATFEHTDERGRTVIVTYKIVRSGY